MKCPICENGTLKKGERMVYCSNYKPKKNDKGEWINEGSCEFRIVYKQKILKEELTPAEIRKLIEGEKIQKGKAKVKFNKDSKFYLDVEFEKTEDPDL